MLIEQIHIISTAFWVFGWNCSLQTKMQKKRYIYFTLLMVNSWYHWKTWLIAVYDGKLWKFKQPNWNAMHVTLCMWQHNIELTQHGVSMHNSDQDQSEKVVCAKNRCSLAFMQPAIFCGFNKYSQNTCLVECVGDLTIHMYSLILLITRQRFLELAISIPTSCTFPCSLDNLCYVSSV